MDETYTPIPCALYSEYELVILRRQSLRISWVDGRGVTRIETLTPKNLRTRRHQEFMIAEKHSGARHVLRLDRIRHAEVIDTGVKLV